jgi:hypothetical protein
MGGNDTFYKGPTFSSFLFSLWKYLAHMLNFDCPVSKKNDAIKFKSYN